MPTYLPCSLPCRCRMFFSMQQALPILHLMPFFLLHKPLHFVKAMLRFDQIQQYQPASHLFVWSVPASEYLMSAILCSPLQEGPSVPEVPLFVNPLLRQVFCNHRSSHGSLQALFLPVLKPHRKHPVPSDWHLKHFPSAQSLILMFLIRFSHLQAALQHSQAAFFHCLILYYTLR